MDASLRSSGQSWKAWMLRFAQHDGVRSCRTLLVMACALFPRHPSPLFLVIPSESEESSAWILRFAQHDKSGLRMLRSA
jgi:hypothetical protein